MSLLAHRKIGPSLGPLENSGALGIQSARREMRGLTFDNQPVVMHIAPGYRAVDPRLYYLECDALVKAGCTIELVAHASSPVDVNPQVTLHSLGEHRSMLAWRLVDRFQRDRKAYEMALRSQAALFHYHGLEFTLWGRRLRRVSGRPVIFDCREDYEGYARQRRGIPEMLRPFLARLVRAQLRFAARNSDATVVADQGTADLLSPYARRLVVLHNFPRVELFDNRPPASADKPYDIVLHGSLPKYHLEVCLAIDAALIERGYSAHWLLIGKIPEMNWLTLELARRGSTERFHLKDFIPHREVASELSKAKTGIIPLPNLPKFQNNIPQKLFEFMALGIPVVLSDLPPSRPFVADGRSAIMVAPEDHGAYADAFIRLLTSPRLREEMGREGRKRVMEEYNWEKESQKLLNLYRELLPA
jgi:glycosyltransferase involved in cell wall biosynthesis